MQNRFDIFRFQGFPERAKKISLALLILGIASAAVPIFKLSVYIQNTPVKKVLSEVPAVYVLLAVLLINLSILLHAGGGSTPETRRRNILNSLLVWMSLIYFFNSLLPNINWNKLEWQPAQTVTSGKTTGIDFEAGIYYPARNIIEDTGNYYVGYPPVVTLLLMPLTFLPFPQAYAIFLTLVYAASAASILGANLFAESVSETDQGLSWGITGMMVMYTLTSYGMFFSVERGNFDVFAVLFALIGILYLVKFPDKIWIPALFLSIAAHMKVYPAILLFILLWKHGRKSILPLITVNIGLSLVLGIKIITQFVTRLITYSQDPYITVKNSSAVSFAKHLIAIQKIPMDEHLLTWLLMGIPLLIWLGATVYLYKKGFSNLGMLWYFVISFAPMFALPSVSHDYKLVILGAPLMLALFRLARLHVRTGSFIAAALVILMLVAALFLHRSVLDSKILLLQNKYCAILAFQVLSACGMYMDFSLQKADSWQD